ncbi:hypothetical protein EDC94DRAFT_651032 [Helicostylum pulchrum]|nr:hypothetical protein EDC94DRAFT_651032 [Helicostylum pulchrum]
MNLNQQQKEIHKAVLSEKKNVFIIGPAGIKNYEELVCDMILKTYVLGSGKSALLKYIPDQPVDYYISKVILCEDSDLLPPGARRETFESEICHDVIDEGSFYAHYQDYLITENYIAPTELLLYNSLLVIKLKIEDPSNIVQELHQQLLISQIKDFRISDIYGEFLVVKFRNGEIELLRDVQMG